MSTSAGERSMHDAPRLLVGPRLMYSPGPRGARLDVASSPPPRRRAAVQSGCLPAAAVAASAADVEAVEEQLRAGARVVRLSGQPDAAARLLRVIAGRPRASLPDGVVCVDRPAGALAVARTVWSAAFTAGDARYTPLPAQLQADLANVAALVLVDGWDPTADDVGELRALLPRCAFVAGGERPAAEPDIADLALAGWIEAAHRAADRAVAAVEHGPPGDRARARHERGTLAALLDRRAEAAADLTEAAALHRAAGDKAGAALARHNLSIVAPETAAPLAWLVAAALLALLVVAIGTVASRDSKIDFGEVAVGDAAGRIEQLGNPAGDRLEVALTLSGSPAFAVDLAPAGCPVTGGDAPVLAVPAGTVCDVEIVFTPDLPAGVDAADFAGELSFAVIGGRYAGGTWDVALRGRGVAGAGPAVSAAPPTTATANRPPDLARLPDQTLPAGGQLSVDVAASDPDGDPITLSAAGLPAWATFTDNGDGTGTVTGTPTDADTGTTQSRITATAGGQSDTETLTIRVGAPLDGPPDLAPPGTHTVVAGQPITVTIAATDPNGDPITLTAPDLPAWTTLTDNGDGTGTVTGTPADADTGRTQSRITATANGVADTDVLTIVVEPRPDDPPNLTNVGTHTVGVGQVLDVTVLAIDPDGDPISLTAADLPAWATLIDNRDGTGRVSGTPTDADTGTTQSRITATAKGQRDTETLTIVVIGPGGGPIDERPQLANPGSHIAVAGEPFTLTVTATDPDGDPITLTAPDLPAWATLIDDGDGTGTITGTPTDADTGTTQSRITATANTRTDTEILTIVVEERP